MPDTAVFEPPDVLALVFPLPGLVRWTLQLLVLVYGSYYVLRGADRVVANYAYKRSQWRKRCRRGRRRSTTDPTVLRDRTTRRKHRRDRRMGNPRRPSPP